MSDRKDSTPGAPLRDTPDPAGKAEQAPSAAGSRPGRIGHDARGNAVWQWNSVGDTGAGMPDSTSGVLRKLDVPDLALLDEIPAAEAQAAASPPEQRFNPYAGGSVASTPPKAARPAPASAPAVARAPAVAPKPGLLGRLLGRGSGKP